GAFVITVGFALFSYTALVSLIGLAREGRIPAELASWLPNALFALLAATTGGWDTTWWLTCGLSILGMALLALLGGPDGGTTKNARHPGKSLSTQRKAQM
ncbi:MAG: hypothetical protein ACK4K6_18225, partial [Pseudarthrobacter sp.]